MSLDEEIATLTSLKPEEYVAYVSPKLDDILKTDVALKALITSSNAISTSNIPKNMDDNTLVQEWVWIKTNTSSMWDFHNGNKNVESEVVKNGYVVFLSVSGNSKNLANGLKWCKKNNVRYATLTGCLKNNFLKK